jgi:tryptophan-rich sensory protein
MIADHPQGPVESRPPRRKQLVALVVLVALPWLAGLFGAQFQPGAWYASLAKPAWNPPSAVFGPVWSVLYTLMGVAAWWVWSSPAGGRRAAVALFVVHLLFNAAWSWLFFGLNLVGAALVDLLVVLVLVAVLTVWFWRISALAGALFVPYLAWVGYATSLNLALWRLNASP